MYIGPPMGWPRAIPARDSIFGGRPSTSAPPSRRSQGGYSAGGG